MTKIKGAIEVHVNDLGEVFDIEVCQMQEVIPNGLALTHADLEAYVQERERNAFEAARVWHDGWAAPPEVNRMSRLYPTFEDFKKENHE